MRSIMTSCLLVPSWVVPPGNRGYGLLDMRPGRGISDGLRRMNLRLCEALESVPNAFPLDAGRWLGAGGRLAFDPRLWFTAKVPFASAVFAEAAREIKAGLRALRGEGRKLVIVDLDDTLWGGLVGEVGWEGLRLGGHDHVGIQIESLHAGLLAAEGSLALVLYEEGDHARTARSGIELNVEPVLVENAAGFGDVEGREDRIHPGADDHLLGRASL